MGQTGHGQIYCNLKVSRFNSNEKTASKVSKTINDLNKYVPKTLVKKEVKKSNTLILLLKLFSLYLCQPQTHNQINRKINDHDLIVSQLIDKYLLVQTNM